MRNILKNIELKELNKAESSCKTCIARRFVGKYRFITLLEALRCLKVLKIFFIKRKLLFLSVALKINEIRLDSERLVGSCWPCCLPPLELSFPSCRPGSEGTARSDWLPLGAKQSSAPHARAPRPRKEEAGGLVATERVRTGPPWPPGRTETPSAGRNQAPHPKQSA